MNWNFSELQKHREPLEFAESISVKEQLLQRFPDEILNASDFKVEFKFTSENQAVILEGHLVGQIIVPSSRSLEPVSMPLDFKFTEIYIDSEEKLTDYAEDEVVLVVEDDLIELNRIVEDNIYLQIPMQILTPEEAQGDVMPSGKEWQVTSEESLSQEDQPVDPRFAKLQDYFKE